MKHFLLLSLFILCSYPQLAITEESEANRYKERAREEIAKAREYEELARKERKIVSEQTQKADRIALHKTGWDNDDKARSNVLLNLVTTATERINEYERLSSEARARALEYEKLAIRVIS